MTSISSTRLGQAPEEGIKAPCVVATIVNSTLQGLPIISTYQLVAGDRVLVRSQTDKTENGIYIAAAGSWDRANDWNDASDVANGQLVGDANSTVIYQASFTAPFVINTTSVDFIESIAAVVSISGQLFDPKDFDATSSVDSNVEIQAAIDAAEAAGGSVYLSGTYRSDESNDAKGLRFFGPGKLDYRNAVTLSISNTCLYSAGSLTDLGSPSVNMVKGKSTITMTTTPTGLSLGDVIIIGSTDQYSDDRVAYKKGEAPIVNSISGNDIEIRGSFLDDYTAANVTIFKLNPTSPKFDDITILAPNFPLSRGIWVKNGQNVRVACEVIGGGTNAIQLQQCFDTTVDGAYAHEERDSTATTTGTEYGLAISNCQRISILNSTLSGERHGLTTGGFENDFPNEIVAMVNREIQVVNSWITNDTLFTDHLGAGTTLQSFDLHGNTEFMTVTNCVIMNGMVWAGNHNQFTNNIIYGTNDNSNNMMRIVGLTGFDHKITGNTVIANVRPSPLSSDKLFVLFLATQTGDGTISSNNALRFGGDFAFGDNTFICDDATAVANTVPIEFQYRLDTSFTEDCSILTYNNTVQMPKGSTLFSAGMRLLALSNNVQNAPRAINLFTNDNNRFINCGGLRTAVETATTQYSVDEVVSRGMKVRANNQAPDAFFLTNVKESIEIIDCSIKEVTQAPINFSSTLTTQNSTTLCQSVTIKGNGIRDSITTGVSSTTKTMGVLQGFRELTLEDNTNHNSTEFTGTHDGAGNAAALTDTTASFVASSLIGKTITNVTDGSSSTITANTATTITGVLSGGTDDDWDVSDVYIVSKGPATNFTDLFYLDGGAGSKVWRKDNIDTSGIRSYQLDSDYFTETEDHFSNTVEEWEDTVSAASAVAYGTSTPYDTSGGAFALSMATATLYTDAEFSVLDITGDFATNNLTLTYNGSQTIMGNAGDYILDLAYSKRTFKLFGNDWRVI